MNSPNEDIKRFIITKFPIARKTNITYEDSLLDSGIVDSLGVLEVVSYLVENHEIEIGEDDLMPENFNSIQSIADFIEKKKKSFTA